MPLWQQIQLLHFFVRVVMLSQGKRGPIEEYIVRPKICAGTYRKRAKIVSRKTGFNNIDRASFYKGVVNKAANFCQLISFKIFFHVPPKETDNSLGVFSYKPASLSESRYK